MKKITMFILDTCPYCVQALHWMDELFAMNPSYKALDIEIINERINPEASNKYNYDYVPAFFIGDEKLHNGVASRDIIRRVFDTAII